MEIQKNGIHPLDFIVLELPLAFLWEAHIIVEELVLAQLVEING
tara:strand:- start:90 stop:221 length:132 start_codon:yes stop_codon:yes gene_type:complete